MHLIGLDVHRQFVAYCVQNAAGERLARGNIAATRDALPQWAGRLPPRCSGATEAATFSGWIYDTLRPFAVELAVPDPAATVHRLKKPHRLHPAGARRRLPTPPPALQALL